VTRVVSEGRGLGWKLNYAWRVVGTGWCFLVFGVMSFVAGATLFPLLCLTTRDPEVARRRAQGLTHRWFGLFVAMMSGMRCMSYEIQGRERLRQGGHLIVANHPSLIDVVFMISLLPEVDCIIKPAIFRNPFMKWPAIWSGYIAQSSPEQLIRDCAASLAKGHSVLVFPEGTRTVPGQPIHMTHGAARMALDSNCTILPVTIRVTPPHLFKNEPWWRVPVTKPHYVFTVGEPYAAGQFLQEAGGVPSLAARRLTKQWERYFTAGAPTQYVPPLAQPAVPAQYSP
jgi:1-acyl-sn-glycerol-3-phosphate acyltransferase